MVPFQVPNSLKNALRLAARYLTSERIVRTLFSRLSLELPGSGSQHLVRFVREMYGPGFGQPPHTDDVWEATLQLYFPELSTTKEEELAYGTCFHELQGSQEPVTTECALRVRYQPNSGYIFKASNTSYHSGPDFCLHNCCTSTRYVLMVNWIRKHKWPKWQKLLSGMVQERRRKTTRVEERRDEQRRREVRPSLENQSCNKRPCLKSESHSTIALTGSRGWNATRDKNSNKVDRRYHVSSAGTITNKRINPRRKEDVPPRRNGGSTSREVPIQRGSGKRQRPP